MTGSSLTLAFTQAHTHTLTRAHVHTDAGGESVSMRTAGIHAKTHLPWAMSRSEGGGGGGGMRDEEKERDDSKSLGLSASPETWQTRSRHLKSPLFSVFRTIPFSFAPSLPHPSSLRSLCTLISPSLNFMGHSYSVYIKYCLFVCLSSWPVSCLWMSLYLSSLVLSISSVHHPSRSHLFCVEHTGWSMN